MVGGGRERLGGEADCWVREAGGVDHKAIECAIRVSRKGDQRLRANGGRFPGRDLDVDAYDGRTASEVDEDFGVADVEHDERRSAEDICARRHDCFVTMYHKGFRRSNKVKVIHRYVPREVGELLVWYMW